MSLTFRPAVRTDAEQILTFITELAEYERARHEVVATLADIEHSLFDEGSTVHALMCERDGRAIGFAVYFYSYSTWLGRNGIYLEDLYVTPNIAAMVPAGSCCSTLPAKRWRTTVGAWNGVCWTGTSQRSASTRNWGPRRRMSGCATGWMATSWRHSPAGDRPVSALLPAGRRLQA